MPAKKGTKKAAAPANEVEKIEAGDAPVNNGVTPVAEENGAVTTPTVDHVEDKVVEESNGGDKPAAKAGRGRPKKAETAPVAAEPAGEKKGRGRPAKAKAVESSNGGSVEESVAPSEAKKAKEAVTEELEVKAAVKGRGRPKKVQG